ncbi:hypothetical protein M8818_002035 [Zalaria obscura]|uniref:Uncharacterized protein n=1 Tax=Zalaria obscura TaxID=2024903 RepID=A0ACC3SJC8_9PEZI
MSGTLVARRHGQGGCRAGVNSDQATSGCHGISSVELHGELALNKVIETVNNHTEKIFVFQRDITEATVKARLSSGLDRS